MGNVTHGMNVDEVEALGQLLQGKADQLRQVVNDLERVLGHTIWEGADAAAFKQQWWPGHRSRLQAVANQVHGFGQSALNNASEQRTASGVASGGETSGGRSGSGGSAVPPLGSPGPLAPGSPAGDGYAAHFTDGSTWVSAWRPGANGMDQWNFRYDGDGDAKFGNCTSFVAWRLNQLAHASGHQGYSMTNNHLDLGNGTRFEYGRLGNAYEWYGHAPAELRSTEPSVGSVLVWGQGDGKGSDGHVAIVRGVHPDGSITIEDSAWDSRTYGQQTLRPGSYPSKFLNLLP